MSSWLPSVFSGGSAPQPQRPGFSGGDAWFPVGTLSCFPNITSESGAAVAAPAALTVSSTAGEEEGEGGEDAAVDATTKNKDGDEAGKEEAAEGIVKGGGDEAKGDKDKEAAHSSADDAKKPSCRVFHVPRDDSSAASRVPDAAVAAALAEDSAAPFVLPPPPPPPPPPPSSDDTPSSSPDPGSPTPQPSSARASRIALNASLSDQVLIFRHNYTIHAIDNRCPHAAYPLSNGTAFDIEDFGLKLSSGIRCPRHGWCFDLFRGNGDRGTYRLKVWEVAVRGVGEGGPPRRGGGGKAGGEGVNEDELMVWVRRKQRMG